MIINFLFLIINIFYFIITSIEDIKKKETYDFYNYSYIFLMIILSISYILIFKKFDLIYNISFSFLLGFFFALFLVYIGFWGGGDSKLLLGFSITIPFLLEIFSYKIFNYDFNLLTNLLVNFNLTYLAILNILIFMSLIFFFESKKKLFLEAIFLTLISSILFFIETKYSILFSFFLAFIFFFCEEIFEITHKKKEYSFLNYFIIFQILIIIINFLNQKDNLEIFVFMINFLFFSIIFASIFLVFYSIYLYLKNYKINKLYFFLFLLSIILFTYFLIKSSIFLIIFTLPIFYFIFIFFKRIEKDFFIVKRKLKDLVLGDWIFEDVKVKKKVVYKKSDFHLGINQKQLSFLKKNFSQNKEFLVKDGIAFIPFLFGGFLIYLILSL